VRTLSVLLVHLGGRDGGAERQTVALMTGLTARGHRVLALVRRGTPIERRAVEAGAPIFPLEPRFPLGPGGIFTWWSRGRARHLASRGAWHLAHFTDPEAYPATAPLLEGGRGDGSIAASRTIVSWRGGRGEAVSRPPAFLRRHQRAGGTIAVASEALWAALVRDGFDEDRLSVVHPGIDVKRFAAAAAARGEERKALGFSDGDEVVGAVAALDRDRGLAELIEAAAILRRGRPRVRLAICGEGPGRRSLEAAAARLGLAGAVAFTGWREDVSRFLQALDVYAFTGRGEEVFPASLIEAMAASVPVIVCDQPGIREIIENGKQGLIVPERGAAALARTIFRALAEPDLTKSMGRAGAVRVQRFHTQAMIDGTEALYYRATKIPKEG
jgi:glycosyltransferase involved in cell wall biosynthesis